MGWYYRCHPTHNRFLAWLCCNKYNCTRRRCYYLDLIVCWKHERSYISDECDNYLPGMRSGVLPAPHLVRPSGQGQPPSAICVIRFESKARTKLEKPDWVYLSKCTRGIPLHNIRYQRIWCCCNIILVLSCNKHKCNSQRSSSLGLSVRKTKKPD